MLMEYKDQNDRVLNFEEFSVRFTQTINKKYFY